MIQHEFGYHLIAVFHLFFFVVSLGDRCIKLPFLSNYFPLPCMVHVCNRDDLFVLLTLLFAVLLWLRLYFLF